MRKIPTLLWVLSAGLLGLGRAAPADAATAVRCESRNGGYQYCAVRTDNAVRLTSQLSGAGCWQNDTWGYDRNGVWVSNGCRAIFEVGHGSDSSNAGAAVGAAVAVAAIAAIIASSHDNDHGNDRYPDQGYYPGNQQRVRCKSEDYRRSYCPLDTWSGRVEIARQYSQSGCQFRRSWGYDRRGVWVDDGCDAEFVVWR